MKNSGARISLATVKSKIAWTAIQIRPSTNNHGRSSKARKSICMPMVATRM